ncbi:kinesin light chain [Podospora fimiseda]|uniref:Kinesin light chain n=1 Tax=Podospora fimiseda TaxID=252190 RepID=A0AAN6YPT6_9PEZI|nr:kinesin light chain [Podospora fimiseda]
MANLASTYRNQGRWEEAEMLFVQVMETRKTKLGAYHPYTLTSMANLASTYRNQGRLEEAEKLFVQVMETSEMKLGADHPDTLISKQRVGAEEALIQSQDGEQRSHGNRKTGSFTGSDHFGTVSIGASVKGRWGLTMRSKHDVG